MADFMVVAAEAVVARLEPSFDANNKFKSGTWAHSFMNQFRLGRTTNDECKEARGLMPNPENGCDDLKAVFLNHVFYERWRKRTSWYLTTAISGAHTIGSAKLHNSGYEGSWSNS